MYIIVTPMRRNCAQMYIQGCLHADRDGGGNANESKKEEVKLYAKLIVLPEPEMSTF